MKKRERSKYVNLTDKRGISLIVLIITIIVIIILAAAVILTITKNNPVSSAKESAFKEDVRIFQDDLALTVAKEYTDKQGQRDQKISTSDYNKITNYIPSFTEKYKGKFIIQDDQLIGTDKLSEKEKTWSENLNISNLEIKFNDISDWEYTIDDENNKVILTKYVGNSTYLAIPNSYTINGKVYNVEISSVDVGAYSGWGYKFSSPFVDCTGYETYSGEGLKLETIILKNDMESIPDHLFAGCKNLKEIKIYSDISSIDSYSFDSCSNLTTIVIQDSFKNIGDWAFNNCKKLSSINIPEKLNSIGDYAFSGCENLTNITIPEGITNIGNNAFMNTSFEKNLPYGPIYFKKILYKIKENAGETTVCNIKDGTTTISNGAFEQIPNLKEVTIPNSVTNIGDYAFAYCGLKIITYKGTQSQWNNIDKASDWNINSALETITCTDGEITL